MEFFVNIDGGGARRTSTIHAAGCSWAKPVVKENATEYWLGALTLVAAQKVIKDMGIAMKMPTCCFPQRD